MKILGIDYGRSKIGVAIADGPLAEPMQVIRYSNTKILMEKLQMWWEFQRVKLERSLKSLLLLFSH
ncbi:MAG: hypothetical protein UT96_C0022G0009 [Candidatus Woesebacteria bacterium GW2011_GWC2_40_30]|nr:MAG: hypothetical protein UT96_C0022G0009 [Candidatus Woesebacteria bacterium GW2011_GWC2_40_30]